MNITITTIPHNRQDYDTVGNWKISKDGAIKIFVSQLSDWRYEFAVALHELVEVGLCKVFGVKQEAVDEFDIEYEKQRKKSLTLDLSEPGDNRFAPYAMQHCVATGIERIWIALSGCKWNDYECEINALVYDGPIK